MVCHGLPWQCIFKKIDVFLFVASYFYLIFAMEKFQESRNMQNWQRIVFLFFLFIFSFFPFFLFHFFHSLFIFIRCLLFLFNFCNGKIPGIQEYKRRAMGPIFIFFIYFFIFYFLFLFFLFLYIGLFRPKRILQKLKK
jgi:hypothetical protein